MAETSEKAKESVKKLKRLASSVPFGGRKIGRFVRRDGVDMIVRPEVDKQMIPAPDADLYDEDETHPDLDEL